MNDNARRRHWPKGWLPPKDEAPGDLGQQDIRRLLRWMNSMVEWGKNVRDDIIRLESATGIGPGDPGDPPPTPWRPEVEDEG